MKYPIEYKHITSKLEFYSEVKKLKCEAETYLLKFKWCKQVRNCRLYTNVGKACCIFLFEIENIQSKEDNFLWIIVGDFPPMYLDVYGTKSTKNVLETYIELAQDWINSINLGKSIAECYPFNAGPTKEMADLLQVKVNLIKYSA